MDIMEKVEALREKANISYEEAKNVLELANGDLLDAMVILERQSKIKKPETEISSKEETFEHSEEQAAEETSEHTEEQAAEKAEADKKTKTDTFGKKLNTTVKKVAEVLTGSSFCVTRNEKNLFTMPAWVLALILLFTWKTIIPVMLISLFFKVRYSFTGTDDLSSANDFMDKVGHMAEDVADGLKA